MDGLAGLVSYYARVIAVAPSAAVYGEIQGARTLAGTLLKRGPKGARPGLSVTAGWLSSLLAITASDLGGHAAAMARRIIATAYPSWQGEMPTSYAWTLLILAPATACGEGAGGRGAVPPAVRQLPGMPADAGICDRRCAPRPVRKARPASPRDMQEKSAYFAHARHLGRRPRLVAGIHYRPLAAH